MSGGRGGEWDWHFKLLQRVVAEAEEWWLLSTFAAVRSTPQDAGANFLACWLMWLSMQGHAVARAGALDAALADWDLALRLLGKASRPA